MASHLMKAFARFDIEAIRGEGCYLFDANGKRYLDFLSGVAVNAFGHCHPLLVEVLCQQAKILWHSSNLLHIPEQERLADRICAASFADAVFFTNSGSEAVDFSLKLVRRYFKSIGQPERWRVVTFADAFHGRSMAAIAAGGQPKLTQGFEPVVTGFDNVPFGDLDHLTALIGPETAAVMLEPVQGEGGIRVFEPNVLKKIRHICDQHGILLVLDEVQTGFGRTGKLFAHEWAGVRPDIVAAAKGIGAGYPLGAVLASAMVGASITPGSHGSTIGGAPLAVAVGNAVLDLLLADGFLDDAAGRSGTVSRAGERLRVMLGEIVDEFPDLLEEVRGLGLLIGLKCRTENYSLMSAMRDVGLLTAPAGQNVIRILPPLNVAQEQIEEAGALIRRVCADFRAREQNRA
jgi:acetylornithine/N-succinyldiaminopimelate aminotransferase